MNIIVEGHTDGSGRETTNPSFYNLSRTNDILYLYENRGNESDLSYLRARAVSSYLTNVMRTKLINIGVQNLINPYDDDALNRRVEFIIIENSNDINIYNNYFRNNWFSKINFILLESLLNLQYQLQKLEFIKFHLFGINSYWQKIKYLLK